MHQEHPEQEAEEHQQEEVEDGEAQLSGLKVDMCAPPCNSSSTVHSSQSSGRLVALSLARGQPTTTAHCGPPSYHPLLWQGPSLAQGVQLYWASLSLSPSLLSH